MDKKKILKWILIACGVILVIFVVGLLLRNNSGEEVVKNRPLNQKVNLEQVFAEIEKIDKMEVTEEAKEGQIDFGKYEVLEKKAIVNTTDEEINEVWMIKLSDKNQQEEISRILGNRISKLRKGFEGNEAQQKILDNAVIKQEDSIVIMIIGQEAMKIEKTIAEAMK